MLILFCQPSLQNKNTVDYLIREIIVKNLELKKYKFCYFDSNQGNRYSIGVENIKKKIPKKISLLLDGILMLINLKKFIKNKNTDIIFLDSYNIFQLFFFSLINFSNKTKIILYLRIPYDFIPFIKYFFIFLLKT